MLSSRTIALVCLTLCHLTGSSLAEQQNARDLLKSVPEEYLDAALHTLQPVYKDGTFDHPRSAVNAIIDQDPDLAERLIEAVKVDIVKRQMDNTTTATSASISSSTVSSITITAPETSSSMIPTSSSPVPSSTSPIGVVNPSTSSAAPSTTSAVGPSSATSPSNIIIPIQSSSTNGQGNLVPTVVSSTIPATSPIPTSGPIIGAGTSIASPSAVTETDQYGGQVVLTGATDGAVFTVTDSNGKTVRTTYHPTASAVRSVVIETQTLANGQPETLTSVVAIAPTMTDAGGSQQGRTGTQTATSSIGLVTGNVGVTSRKVGKEVVALVAGAAGVAWFL